MADGSGYPFGRLAAAYFEPSKIVGTAAGHCLVDSCSASQEAIDWVATAMWRPALYAGAFRNVGVHQETTST